MADESCQEQTFHENFSASLKQFISNLEPIIKSAGSLPAAEDILTHLEATDENFHRYEFVRQLRNRINTVLMPVVAEEFEKRAFGGENDQNTIPLIIEELLASREYAALSHSILSSIKDSVKEMIESFDTSSQPHNSWPVYNRRKKFQSVDGTDEESLSSSERMGYMFMPHEKLRSIVQKLEITQSVETRYQALMMLSQIPQGDVVTSEQWNSLKKSLARALGDQDQRLSEASLKLLSKMHIINNGHATREVFTCLTQHLVVMFQDSNRIKTLVDDGLDVSDHENKRILKRFRLLGEFLHEIPSYWIRYPERFVEDILKNSISLLSMGNNYFGLSSFNGIMSPLHYLALLDPKASWFKKWMHGYYSRKSLVEQLKIYPSLLIDCIQHILEFTSLCKSSPLDAVDEDDNTEEIINIEEQQTGEGKRGFYTSQQLDYMYFVHSLCLVGRLLLYHDGRQLFPITIPDSDEAVSTTDLVSAFIEIMSSSYPNCKAPHLREHITPGYCYHPGEVVVTVLKEIASSSIACQALLCKDSIANALLLPIQNYLEGVMTYDEEQCMENNTLLFVADVLACLASSECGRKLLLYGERNERWQRNRFSPAHTIIEFTKKALTEKLPGDVTLSHTAVGAFVFVCRQLYNGCEGLLVTSHYGLHQCIADAWRSSNAQDTEKKDLGSQIKEIESCKSILSICLIDNLLNFAGTPKGVLLLQQSGAMSECVSYMYERYTKKLQVSKCEKFGYGVMVTQISATCPGIVSLKKSGFIISLLHDLWFCLEGGQDDNKILSPRIKENHIEKTLHKVLLNLLNILSSFPAVYELIGNQPLSKFSPKPRSNNITTSENRYPYPVTVIEIIERLVLIGCEEKVHLLLCFEESHLFGLRLLNVMCTSLDTFLLLQTQYKIQEVLLKLQATNVLNDRSKFVVDACSMERNHILVRTYYIGGPSERHLPPRILSKDSHEAESFPMFSSYPPPSTYYLPTTTQTSKSSQDDDLSKLVDKSNSQSKRWVTDYRENFISMLKESSLRLKTKASTDLLEHVVESLASDAEEAIFPLIDFSGSETILKGVDLSQQQYLGVKLAIRYGNQLKLLHSTDESALVLLLKKVKCFLQGQQHKPVDCHLIFLGDYFPGFDWFAATIFLLLGGNGDKTWDMLFKFSSLVSSAYLWTPRLHASVHLPASLMGSGIPTVYSSVCHNIELLLQAEVPLTFSAFRMSGYTPSQICQHWLTQCFWNYLDWENVCSYIFICLILGIDYQVYFCVAVLRHLQRHILHETQRQSLLLFLKEQTIQDFLIADHIDFMKDLEKRYRSTILKDLQNITKA